MQARKNELDLFEFSVKVTGPNVSKTLKGIVDTGSTFCACTHKVITTLRIRPIDFRKVAPIGGDAARRLIYEAEIGFDGRSAKSEIARLETLPKGIDFILGLSILEKCNWSKCDTHLEISWKEISTTDTQPAVSAPSPVAPS